MMSPTRKTAATTAAEMIAMEVPLSDELLFAALSVFCPPPPPFVLALVGIRVGSELVCTDIGALLVSSTEGAFWLKVGSVELGTTVDGLLEGYTGRPVGLVGAKDLVGFAVGVSEDGRDVNTLIGSATGAVLGDSVGAKEGTDDGSAEGAVVGSKLGANEGIEVGDIVGSKLGAVVGTKDGLIVGMKEGVIEGSIVGSKLGRTVDGSADGRVVTGCNWG